LPDSFIPGLPGLPGGAGGIGGVTTPDVSGLAEVFNGIAAMNHIDVMGYMLIIVCVIVMLGSFSMILINMSRYRG
jgi:hypothetical protein